MLEWYKKFCCGVYYLLREKAKSDIPFFATFMFTLFLFLLIINGIDSLIFILFNTRDWLSRYVMYGLVFIIAIPNYLFVFKDKKFLDFYEQKPPHLRVVLLILLIFFSSLSLILIGGVRNGGNG